MYGVFTYIWVVLGVNVVVNMQYSEHLGTVILYMPGGCLGVLKHQQYQYRVHQLQAGIPFC